MLQPKISIIILHIKDVDGLFACLTSLREVRSPRFDVILVHNGPRDPEIEEKTAPFSAMMSGVIHTGGNYGFAQGTI
jgi:GT2 family glycosyltransferase